ncbi:MAG TPA: hypothetical protein VH518_20145 [Tepidisphaeraceae bacterium]|jgi:hypothetical protein
MSSRRPLDVIQVNNPCPADWDQMVGDDSRRFCEHCRKFVHNLSEMPADEAERLVCENAGNLCVRFERNMSSGEVITLNYATAPRTSRGRAIMVVASILSSLGFTGAWTAYKLFRKPDPPQVQMMLGDISPVRPSNPVSNSQGGR